MATTRSRGWRRAAVVVVATTTLTGAATLVCAVPASAADVPIFISSTGPLQRITTTPDLNCIVDRDGVSPTWNNRSNCGTFLGLDDATYGPARVTAGRDTQTPWTFVSQATRTGDGTTASPYAITVDVRAGDSGFDVSQTDSYVVGELRYRTDLVVTNSGDVARDATLTRAADCAFPPRYGVNDGFGRLDPGAAPTCAAMSPADPSVGGADVESMIPLTAGSSYLVDEPDVMWSAVMSGDPLPGTCRCDATQGAYDVAAALGWSFTLAPGGSGTYSFESEFSLAPLVASLAPAGLSVPQGGRTGFAVTVTNPSRDEQVLTSFAVDLPRAVAYLPGSTTGATTADPVVTGQRLTWRGHFALDRYVGTARLHLLVRARPDQPDGDASIRAWGTAAPRGREVLAAQIAVHVGPLRLTAVQSPVIAVGAQDVQLKLVGTLFDRTAQVTVSGDGVTVSPVDYVSTVDLRVRMSAAVDAALGPRDVTVALADGRSAGCAGCLEVIAAPTVTGVSPAAVGLDAGEVTFEVRGTGFSPYAFVSIYGGGLVTESTTVVDDTLVRLRVLVTKRGTPGEVAGYLSASGGGKASLVIRVDAAPIPTQVTPGVLTPGTSTVVTVGGTGFQPHLTVRSRLVGVSFAEPRNVTPTSFTVRVTVAADAPRGQEAFRLTNPDLGRSSRGVLQVT